MWRIKLHLAFQVISTCQRYNLEHLQGITPDRAREVVLEITGITLHPEQIVKGPTLECYLESIGIALAE